MSGIFLAMRLLIEDLELTEQAEHVIVHDYYTNFHHIYNIGNNNNTLITKVAN